MVEEGISYLSQLAGASDPEDPGVGRSWLELSLVADNRGRLRS